MVKRVLFFITILFINGLLSAAQTDTIYISSLDEKLMVADKLDYFQSKEKIDLHLENYIKQPWQDVDSIFQSPPTDLYTYLLISFSNDTDVDKEVVFDLDDPSIYEVESILIDHNTNGEQEFHTGISIIDKNIKSTDNAFQFILKHGHRYTLVCRIETKNFTSLNSELYSVKRYTRESTVHFLIFGIYYGIVLAIIIYAVLFYLSSGLKWFLYFSISTFFFSIITGDYDGFTGYLIPEVVDLFNGYHDLFCGGVSNIFTLLFASSFLAINKISNNFYRLYLFLIGLNILSFILYFFIPTAGFYIVIVNAIVGTPLIAFTSIYYYKKGDRSLFFFTLAYLIFTIFIFISALYLFRAIPSNKFTYYSLHIGYLIHLLFLSTVLISKVRNFRKEVDQQKIINALNERKMYEKFNLELEDTVRIRTEDLALKEINLRTILENNDIGIWLTDKDLRIIECNHKAKEFFFHSNKYENFGKDSNLRDVLNNIPDLSSWLPKYNESLQGKELTFEYSYLAKDNIRFLEVHFFPILTAGSVSGVATFINDITDHKNKENVLERTNNELSKLNSELDKFVYGASHDLKAPLGSLKGLIFLLRNESEQEVIEEYLDRMDGSVERMENFITDLVNFSRNSRAELVIEKIDPEKLVNEIIENLKYNEEFKRVKIETNFNLPYDNFYSDVNRISIILSNLISNGLKYHNREESAPYVKVCVNETKDGSLSIIVKDNGLGIDEIHKDKIFEMFYRAHETSDGTGLGLFIVKETTEKLGGDLSLKSKPGEGSEFKIELPNLK
ncbi:7TM diverse intracellular signaling domain-containing protein [Marinigracilibium pacificum]|uniref:histidine kinase n=1 Tax=Marinigracilibium pacificum TaxID=2729599 RepID=A0A848J054_9BACT|nr:7TM diverse intracellular signaling domain-containing protein [Marinigracilibium pacificum]NMM50173.1 PAS domain S-box protein [Marinigracilibium pacificum]